jgi:hypothetical protein
LQSQQSLPQITGMRLVKYLTELADLCREGLLAAEQIFEAEDAIAAAKQARMNLPSFAELDSQHLPSGPSQAFPFDLEGLNQAMRERDQESKAASQQLWRGFRRRRLAVKGVLSTAANVSKMLYPDVNVKDSQLRQVRSSRKDALRQALGAALTPTFNEQCRTVRNDLEHLDDRVDNWVLNSASGSSVSLEGPGIQPLSQVADPGDLFFSFDDRQLVVFFGRHRRELRPLIEGLERLLEASIRARYRPMMDGDEPGEEMVRAELAIEPISRRWV